MQKIMWHSKGKGRPKVAVVQVENPTYYGRCANHKQIPARLYFYKNYHPTESTSGCVIVHLDNDPTNFSRDNLVKISQRAWLLIQNQHLWSDDKDLNRTAILVTTTQDKSKLVYSEYTKYKLEMSEE